MKKWFSKLWNYLFASPPKQELIAVQPPPICGHCGSMDVEVIGTLPVRHFLCRACGKSSSPEPEASTSGTELAIVPARNDSNVLRLQPRNDGLGLVEFLKRQATRRTEEER
jgi:hypothetical protein